MCTSSRSRFAHEVEKEEGTGRGREERMDRQASSRVQDVLGGVIELIEESQRR